MAFDQTSPARLERALCMTSKPPPLCTDHDGARPSAIAPCACITDRGPMIRSLVSGIFGLNHILAQTEPTLVQAECISTISKTGADLLAALDEILGACCCAR
jgi:hypothetical protein